MDNNKLKLAEERFYSRFEALNSEILQEFGKTISKFEGLSVSEAHKLAQQMKNGREIDKIMEDLEKASQLSRKDLEELLEIAAEENIEFANVYYEAKGMDKVSYKDSKQFQNIVKSVEKTTQGVFLNLSSTTAIKLLKDNGESYLKGIREAYEDVIDRCVLAVATGQTNYQKAMYDTIKQLSSSGVKKVYYENEGKKPYARRLDSSVRQNILEGVRQVNIGVQGMDKVSYKDSKQFQDIVKSVEKTTQGVFLNLSSTTAIKLLKDNGESYLKGIREAYEDVIDRCVLAVATGQMDYQKAMYDTIKQLSSSGVKKIFYDNEGKRAYARRLDSSVRMNILDGVRQVNIGIQEQVGKEFGADGVEVSHHVNCAPDHIHIDGQQFSKKKFEKINNNLTRPIASMNCRHFVFSIVLGVSSPLYTKKQLEEDRKNNEKGFEYEGKHYTLYEGEQLQRKIELAVRQQKDLQIIAKASNDKDTISKSQSNITQLTQKYKELSKISGLPTKMDRMRVVGYKRTNVAKMK